MTAGSYDPSKSFWTHRRSVTVLRDFLKTRLEILMEVVVRKGCSWTYTMCRRIFDRNGIWKMGLKFERMEESRFLYF